MLLHSLLLFYSGKAFSWSLTSKQMICHKSNTFVKQIPCIKIDAIPTLFIQFGCIKKIKVFKTRSQLSFLMIHRSSALFTAEREDYLAYFWHSSLTVLLKHVAAMQIWRLAREERKGERERGERRERKVNTYESHDVAQLNGSRAWVVKTH